MAKPITYCTIDGCEARCVGRGWCRMHYYRWKRHGHPLGKAKYRSATGRCEVDGCDRPHWTAGLCNTHYAALRRNGDLVKRQGGPKRRDGHIIFDASGRPGLYVPEHVLARKSGVVTMQRLVLFGKVGLGPHRCHWCEKWVNWGWPMADRLTVDHLDWDPSNNDPSNLVVACHGCNSKRHRPADHPQAPPAGSPSVSAHPWSASANSMLSHRK